MKPGKTRGGFVGVLLLAGALLCAALPEDEGRITPRLSRILQERGLRSVTKAWIYFRDKGPDPEPRLRTLVKTLSPRSIKRRLRNGFEALVDTYDLSVYAPYIQSVKPHVIRVRHASRWLNALSVEATGESLRTIARMPFVRKVDRVLRFRFREPEPGPDTLPEEQPAAAVHVLDYGPSLSQVEQLHVPALHDRGFSGKGVLVCMLDGGFNNLSHEALDHLDVVATWDFVNDDPNVFDELGQMGSGNHGTHTLGTIAGFEPGKLIGPAFGASFLLGKTENSEWERHVEEDDWVAGAEWADALGADIISSSLGYRDRFTHGEVDYGWEDMDGETTVVARGANIAATRGILVVNSAGNEGASIPPENTLVSPADSPHVLAVGAVDMEGLRVRFSSTGPTADGRIKPDVMARGVSVYSASPKAPDAYDLVNGTSFSCPLTAGVAALILEAQPSWTNADIILAMKQTASRSEDPDNWYGWGIVDALAAAFYPLKAIHPPVNFSLQRQENNYGFFIQYVDVLSWSPNPRNRDGVSAYRIYARRLEFFNQPFELVAEVDAQTFNLMRRGLLRDETFLYKITAVSALGEESDPEYARL